MLDGIRGAEILKGVRGAQPVDRKALADMIVAVSKLVTDFPEISEVDLNPIFADPRGAVAVDTRIVLAKTVAASRPRRSQADVLQGMNRIMKPGSIAVIGASAEDGKIGNSVMKNLINGGYQGEIYPINPNLKGSPRPQGLQERARCARRDRSRSLCDPGEVRHRDAGRGRQEEDCRRGHDPHPALPKPEM